MRTSAKIIITGAGSIVIQFGLAIAGWGGWSAFFSHPALQALAWVAAALSLLAVFSGTGMSSGEKEDRANRWVLGAFGAIALLMAYFDAANTISSDQEHQKALTELLHQPGLQPATLAEIAKSAQRISSADEKAKVLSELVALDIQDSTVHRAFFDAVNSISSDEDHARVLSSLGGKAGLTSGTLEEILESASRVSSDEEKPNVVVEMRKIDLRDEGVQSAFFKAADSISSDDEHGRVLTTVLKRHDLSAKVVNAAIESATHISSDDVKAQVLTQVVDAYCGDTLVRAHLRSAVESLESNAQYRKLMSELAKQEASQKQ